MCVYVCALTRARARARARSFEEEDNGQRIRCNRVHDRARHKCIGNSTRAEDSRDGLRQCRHECIYASRLNKIKETPAHPHEWGCEWLWGNGRGRFKNTARDRSGISTAYPSWLASAVSLNLSLAKTLYRAAHDFGLIPRRKTHCGSAFILAPCPLVLESWKLSRLDFSARAHRDTRLCAIEFCGEREREITKKFLIISASSPWRSWSNKDQAEWKARRVIIYSTWDKFLKRGISPACCTCPSFYSRPATFIGASRYFYVTGATFCWAGRCRASPSMSDSCLVRVEYHKCMQNARW